uniref:7TM_GPCR_Srx domain-containing protein n=1 Tax=Heterorhabditis bacteriophora TaxID=37862 RepID=A0A1I7WUM2_HETBA
MIFRISPKMYSEAQKGKKENKDQKWYQYQTILSSILCNQFVCFIYYKIDLPLLLICLIICRYNNIFYAIISCKRNIHFKSTVTFFKPLANNLNREDKKNVRNVGLSRILNTIIYLVLTVCSEVSVKQIFLVRSRSVGIHFRMNEFYLKSQCDYTKTSQITGCRIDYGFATRRGIYACNTIIFRILFFWMIFHSGGCIFKSLFAAQSQTNIILFCNVIRGDLYVYNFLIISILVHICIERLLHINFVHYRKIYNELTKLYIGISDRYFSGESDLYRNNYFLNEILKIVPYYNVIKYKKLRLVYTNSKCRLIQKHLLKIFYLVILCLNVIILYTNLYYEKKIYGNTVIVCQTFK